METKLVRVPFDVELAKRIQNGECEGKIVTRDGRNARVVCWDLKSVKNDYSILSIVNDSKEENPVICTLKGLFDMEAESRNDLMLEIPEYMTFKDLDIIAYDDCDTMAIINAEFFKNDSGDICSKSYITILDEKNLQQFSVSMNGARLATEKEKRKFVNILKGSNELKAKIILKQFFGIEQKQKYEFKPKDWVLCRNGNEDWCLCRFSHVTVSVDRKSLFVAVGGIFYGKCIPYNEQTAYLLGTADNWEE